MIYSHTSTSKHKTLIIAEGGVNHNRILSTAFKLADAAKESGADVFKLQLETPTDYCLCFHDTTKVYQHCESIGIPFACTAFDVISLKFLLDNCKMPFLKLASSSFGKVPIMRAVAEAQMLVIQSVPPDCSVTRPGNEWKCLHVVPEYPTPIEHCNLKRVAEPWCSGLSDHSGNELVPALAVALGAEIIECHITLDRNQEGPDHTSSLTPDMFKRMVENVEMAEKALG